MGASAPAVGQQAEAPQQQQQPATPAQPSENTPTSPAAPQNQTSPATGAQQNGATNPLGTAAAPKQQVTGIMGSRPAGAAIAPARQRRVRTILIKVGVIIGAGVAIGTVAALSKGSPSRPQ